MSPLGRRLVSDRTVHGLTANGQNEIVRYNRAGKWYVEPRDGGKRTHVGVVEAARLAAEGMSYPNLPGGQTFDRVVLEKLTAGRPR